MNKLRTSTSENTPGAADAVDERLRRDISGKIQDMNKKRVLIVDDDQACARILQAGLERTGAYEVQTEQRATNALPAARKFEPDMILLDVCMIDGDGGDVAFALRNDKQLQNIPIVFLTSIISENEARDCSARRGTFPFLAKPARLERVIACIEKHTDTVDLNRQLSNGRASP